MRIVGGQETVRNILVDGGNLYHRALHSFVSNGSDDFAPFASRFVSLLNSYKSEIGLGVYYVFFDGKPARRKSWYPDYKENRAGRSVGIKPDYTEKLILLLKMLGVGSVYGPQEEADDLIYTFIQKHPNNINVVVSDDKDFFPLLENPRVILYRPSSSPKYFDKSRAEEYIREKIIKGPGIPLSKYQYFKALCGDASDNIKGVYRLRKKVASQILEDFDPESVNFDKYAFLTASELAACNESKSRIPLNYRLVSFILIDGFEGMATVGEYSLSDFKAFIKLHGLHDIQYGQFISVTRSVPLPDWLSSI